MFDQELIQKIKELDDEIKETKKREKALSRLREDLSMEACKQMQAAGVSSVKLKSKSGGFYTAYISEKLSVSISDFDVFKEDLVRKLLARKEQQSDIEGRVKKEDADAEAEALAEADFLISSCQARWINSASLKNALVAEGFFDDGGEPEGLSVSYHSRMQFRRS